MGLRDAFAAGAAHLPENAAYGLMALAALGPVFGPQAMMLALVTAVAVNAVGHALGGGWLVSGPRASLALLTAAFVTAVVTRLDATGIVATPWLVLLLLALGVAGAGLLQILFGLLRLGGIVKYTPHPVRQGLSSGVGLLLMLSALPVLWGEGFGGHLDPTITHLDLGALAVGLCALAAAWWTKRRRWPIPPVLAGLASGAAVGGLMALGPAGMAGPALLMGAPALEADWLMSIGREALDPRLLGDRVLFGLVASFAATAAVLCSLDTLLAVSVVDGRLRRGRDASRELVAQGAANVAAACLGGMASSPSIARSLSLLGSQAAAPNRLRAYTLAAGALALVSAPLLSWLPVSAVGGVLLLQGAQMVSPSLWRVPLELWRGRHSLPTGQWRLLAANWAVASTVAVNAMALGLGPAVFIGASFAVLLFVRANMRDVVRQEWTAQTRRSLKMRPGGAVHALITHGHRIVLLEMEGSLFFGTADALRERLQALATRADWAILDLHQVSEVDVTAARILCETAEDWHRQGKQLAFSEWPEADPRRLVLEAVVPPAQRRALQLTATTDAALEAAEDALLAELGVEQADGSELALHETQLGRGLEATELAMLAGCLQTVRFPQGERLFAVGDPGDAMYISIRGDIGLRIPGTTRRLSSFAPGVTMGEMAVLLKGKRSAEAVAETDVVAFRLPADVFDRMMEERPALAAKLLRNMTLHLSDRVRVLTGDLAQWVARTEVRRSSVTALGPTEPPRKLRRLGGLSQAATSVA